MQDDTDWYFTTDTHTGEITPVGGDSTEDLEDGSSSVARSDATDDLSLDATRTVTLTDTTFTSAFDTDTFREYEVVIARPIEQEYVIDEESYTFAKVEEELRKAAWTFDNAPHTLLHPDTGIVRHHDQIVGFHDSPQYIENYDVDGDALVASLYVPEGDEDAIQFIEDNAAVSIGFQNTLDWSVDDADVSEDVDAIQRSMVADHVASVKQGRCSIEDGCGVVEGLASAPDMTRMADGSMGDDKSQNVPTADGCSPGSCSCGKHTENEHSTENMSDGDSGSDGQDNPPAVGELTVDAIAEKNDEVASLQSDKAELEDTVDVLEDAKEDLEGEVSELQDELETYRERERAELVDAITDLTGAWDEDELEDLDLDSLESRLQVAKDAASSEPTAPEGDDPEGADDENPFASDSTDEKDGYTVSNEHRSWMNGDD